MAVIVTARRYPDSNQVILYYGPECMSFQLKGTCSILPFAVSYEVVIQTFQNHENIYLGNAKICYAIKNNTIAELNEVKPTASSRSAGCRSKFMSCFAKSLTNFILQFRRKVLSHACTICLAIPITRWMCFGARPRPVQTPAVIVLEEVTNG